MPSKASLYRDNCGNGDCPPLSAKTQIYRPRGYWNWPKRLPLKEPYSVEHLIIWMDRILPKIREMFVVLCGSLAGKLIAGGKWKGPDLAPYANDPPGGFARCALALQRIGDQPIDRLV
jgi:hypothetical protein